MSRTTRYSGLIPPPPPLSATIVGVGAIGSYVAALLARSGLVTTLTIIDPDEVSLVNLGPQNYNEDEVGKLKVRALGDRLTGINPDLTLITAPRVFKPSDLHVEVPAPPEGPEDEDAEDTRPFEPKVTDYLFVCVDSMKVRREIGEEFGKVVPHCRALFDARMGAEIAQVFTFTEADEYLSTVFPDEEAVALPCSARATPHCPSLAASLLFHNFTLLLRNKVPPKALCLDLSTFMLAEVPLSCYAAESKDAPVAPPVTPEPAPKVRKPKAPRKVAPLTP